MGHWYIHKFDVQQFYIIKRARLLMEKNTAQGLLALPDGNL